MSEVSKYNTDYAERIANEARLFGFACQLMATSGRSNLSLGGAENWVLPPILLGQIYFSFDDSGNPIGFVSWAFVTNSVLEDLSSGSCHSLNLWQWNEGSNLFIIDVVAPFNNAVPLLRGAARTISGHRSVHFVDRRLPGSTKSVPIGRKKT